MEKSIALVSRGGDEDLLPAAGVPRRARGVGADDRVADPDGLRCGRPAVGARDADLPAGHVRAGLEGAAQPCQRAGGHQRRRQDGQEDGVRRQAVDAACAEGARSRRAHRRAAEPVADERHRRRPQGRHQGRRRQHLREPERRHRAQRQQPVLGDGQRDVLVRTRLGPAAGATESSSRCRR